MSAFDCFNCMDCGRKVIGYQRGVHMSFFFLLHLGSIPFLHGCWLAAGSVLTFLNNTAGSYGLLNWRFKVADSDIKG